MIEAFNFFVNPKHSLKGATKNWENVQFVFIPFRQIDFTGLIKFVLAFKEPQVIAIKGINNSLPHKLCACFVRECLGGFSYR